MKERLLHILDQSTCLTRRQMKDYLAGTMLPEEIHAAETHISSCPLCSMAMEGFQEHTDEALAAISSLNSGFLKDHFDSISPQIHLNSLAPAIPVAHHSHATHKKKSNIISLLKVGAVAAAVLIGFGIFWIIGSKDSVDNGGMIAQNETAVTTSPEQDQSPVSEQQRRAIARQAPVPVEEEKKSINKPETYTANAQQASMNTADSRIASNSKKEDAAAPAEDRVQALSAGAPSAAPPTPAMVASASKSAAGNAQKDRQGYFADTISSSENYKSKPAAKMLAAREVEAEKKASERSRAEESNDDEVDHLELGNKAFENKSYQSALNHYKNQMNTGRPKRRAEATFKAAQCYKSLGNKSKAISLLKGLVENDGPYHKSAQKLLDEMGAK